MWSLKVFSRQWENKYMLGKSRNIPSRNLNNET
jgi:hypothetical protein